jgi:ketosteroid isomerase-like protein
MSKAVQWAILACGTLLLAAPQSDRELSGGARAAIERAVLEASAGATRAAQTRDMDALFGYMLDTDKGSVVQNGTILRTRQDAREQVSRGMQGIASIEYRWRNQYVTVLSPTTALLVGDGETTATTTDGSTFTAPFAQTNVFVLTDGQWKILHAHRSSPPR